jgi:hypothetical protein
VFQYSRRILRNPPGNSCRKKAKFYNIFKIKRFLPSHTHFLLPEARSWQCFIAFSTSRWAKASSLVHTEAWWVETTHIHFMTFQNSTIPELSSLFHGDLHRVLPTLLSILISMRIHTFRDWKQKKGLSHDVPYVVQKLLTTHKPISLQVFEQFRFIVLYNTRVL